MCQKVAFARAFLVDSYFQNSASKISIFLWKLKEGAISELQCEKNSWSVKFGVNCKNGENQKKSLNIIFKTIYFYYHHMIMATTKFFAIQWQSIPTTMWEKGGREKRIWQNIFCMLLVGKMKGAKRKLPEITSCKHIFMKFYDFLNRKYSLGLCAQFSLMLHIIIDVKRFSFIAFFLFLSTCYQFLPLYPSSFVPHFRSLYSVFFFHWIIWIRVYICFGKHLCKCVIWYYNMYISVFSTPTELRRRPTSEPDPNRKSSGSVGLGMDTMVRRGSD